ncbi:unnamed protein product [Dovyalis caffra]|uniref:Uncharacterized protein n=1 Tax=Dovyalis caffra TaxID=77055 RepID=A0AAV1RI97_9ROSI|nr:unnamed protein product [Dovyalis caffra]
MANKTTSLGNLLNHLRKLFGDGILLRSKRIFVEEFKNAIGKFLLKLSSDGDVYEFKVGGMDGSRIRHVKLDMSTCGDNVDGKNDDYEMVYRNNMMRNAYNIILKSQGNIKAREIVQDGLKKIDKDIENELAKLRM